jgi:hypothetical protein
VQGIIVTGTMLEREHKITLKKPGKHKIEVQAREIHDQTQKKHPELGLAPFDNSVPKSVDNFFRAPPEIPQL